MVIISRGRCEIHSVCPWLQKAIVDFPVMIESAPSLMDDPGTMRVLTLFICAEKASDSPYFVAEFPGVFRKK